MNKFEKNNSNPLISCILCVFNGEKYLPSAIDSILNQTFTDFELILVNDASTDSSRELINSYSASRIRYIENEENLGLTKSLNVGIRAAKGKYIARMDADDTCLPQRFEKQVQIFEKNPELGVVFCAGNGFIERKVPIDSISHESIKFRLQFENPLIHASAMFNTERIKEDLFYDERFRTAQDYELWCRLIQQYEFYQIPEKLMKFRKHEGQISQKKGANQRLNVKKIQENYLEQIGISLTDEQLEILRRIANFHEPVNQYLQSEAEKVFHALKAQWNQLSIENHEIIEQELQQWWLNLMLRAKNHTFSIRKKYIQSDFFSLKLLLTYFIA